MKKMIDMIDHCVRTVGGLLCLLRMYKLLCVAESGVYSNCRVQAIMYSHGV